MVGTRPKTLVGPKEPETLEWALGPPGEVRPAHERGQGSDGAMRALVADPTHVSNAPHARVVPIREGELRRAQFETGA